MKKEHDPTYQRIWRICRQVERDMARINSGKRPWKRPGHVARD